MLKVDILGPPAGIFPLLGVRLIRDTVVPFGTDELIDVVCLALKDEEEWWEDEETVVSEGFIASLFASDGGGRSPLERYEGQWDLSSGKEEPGSR